MSSEDKPITAYSESTFIKAFSQKLPGSDADMKPLAEHTKIEKWDENGKPYLEEYQGSGKLKGKVALITGGDSGIGRSVAMFFAREGADVSISYLPEEQKDAEFVRDAVEKAGRKCVLIPADLEKISECEAVVKKHIEALGRIDILVNNASKQIFCKNIAEIDPNVVKSTFDSNIIQMISLTKYAIPHMRRGGSIVNTTSVTAYQGSPALIDYSSTKGAIVAFTRALAAQLAPKGIRVNAVAPGPVYTPLQPASRSKENMEGWELGGVPLHGRAAQPAELAPSFVFAASPDSNFMTGNVIHINGGMWVGS